MEKLHNLHYFCINGITRCEFQTKITLCFHAQCTNHSVINQKCECLTVRILFDTVIRSALRQMQFFHRDQNLQIKPVFFCVNTDCAVVFIYRIADTLDSVTVKLFSFLVVRKRPSFTFKLPS